MLETLHVKNLAVIDEAEIEFGSGLNIITGETGAGKSVIMGSANLALGAKASKELIRTGEDTAFVEMIFHVTDEEQIKKLAGLDIEPEDERVILSRKITGQKNTCRINSETVTAGKLKEAAEILIDIHGQHEHQKLLKASNHLKLLDSYAARELSGVSGKYKADYAAYREVLKEIEKADMDDEARRREISFTSFEIDEIEKANLKDGEDEELEEYYKKASNSRSITDALGVAAGYLGEGGAADMLSRAVREIGSVTKYDESLSDVYDTTLSLEQLTQDAERMLKDYLSENIFDEGELIRAENRLNEINRLKSKYGKTIGDINNYLEEKRACLDKLTNFEETLESLKTKAGNLKEICAGEAEKISQIRKSAAKRLSEEVTLAMRDLSFEGGRFEFIIKNTDDFGEDGCDRAEIMLCTNPGEPMRPIEKMASGGELSRIMLAVKSASALKDDIETLIFDEIDTGISGLAAARVAKKLEELSQHHQIICITHLPQIAARADSHFMIKKEVADGRTISGVNLLKYDESVREIARMMGTDNITETLLKSAAEMKKAEL